MPENKTLTDFLDKEKEFLSNASNTEKHIYKFYKKYKSKHMNNSEIDKKKSHAFIEYIHVDGTYLSYEADITDNNFEMDHIKNLLKDMTGKEFPIHGFEFDIYAMRITYLLFDLDGYLFEQDCLHFLGNESDSKKNSIMENFISLLIDAMKERQCVQKGSLLDRKPYLIINGLEYLFNFNSKNSITTVICSNNSIIFRNSYKRMLDSTERLSITIPINKLNDLWFIIK